jgi:hypothetical protein
MNVQGYEPSSVPMMVAGVPSMVQCLEFVGELMQQPSQQCQVFAVILTAHIVCKHSSLPQSLGAAQQVSIMPYSLPILPRSCIPPSPKFQRHHQFMLF